MAAHLKCNVFFLLAFIATLAPVWAEWFTYPKKLFENQDYTGHEYIARIRSDKEDYRKIIYSLSGPGVDQPPVGRFGCDADTGNVRVYSILDREEIPFYLLKGMAKYTDGTQAEKVLDLNITVLDVNDCVPVIQIGQVGQVSEASAPGTVVMRVIVTDADIGVNAMIYYSLVQSSTFGMFSINSLTGEIMVQSSALDREKLDTYTLIVLASDLNGQAGANTGTGEIVIKLLDINDNIPTLAQESYEGSVVENTIGIEVMRIQAIDLDLMFTESWMAMYQIVSGNEGGYFTITTDPKTNEGIIMITKALNYEEIKTLSLEVSVSNKAVYNFGAGPAIGLGGGGKTYPIKINVVNQLEGPTFRPSVKVVSISEDRTIVSLSKIIANYAAIDIDTGLIATNVRYAKIRDSGNWLIIDEKTGDIRLNKFPDRESKFLINGTYYAEIIAVTKDEPAKTVTGTVAIQVEDFNDHCPELVTKSQTMCLGDRVIYATAVDGDAFPNAAPFEFTVIGGSTTERWTVEHLNGTTAILRDQSQLWPGKYQVEVQIKDQQGKSCANPQIINVDVCTCNKDTKNCAETRKTTTSTFGVGGILLLLLGLLLLLLLPLMLLFCLCGGTAAIGDFKSIPFDTKQQLIAYHTEGQGEDKEVPLLHVPAEVDGGTLTTKNIKNYQAQGYDGGLVDFAGAAGGGVGGGGAFGTSSWTADNRNLYNQYQFGQFGQGDQVDVMAPAMMTGQEHSVSHSHYKGGVYDGMALSEQFLAEYYDSKLNHAAQQCQEPDNVQTFGYEGQESPAGSVGCCSLLENDDDLAFLNDLGPKFKTLAEVVQGSPIVTESVHTVASVRPVSPIRPSTSTHTRVHTHRETTRDNVNTLNTSNVAPGSSTFIQEERITERVQGSGSAPKVHVQDNIVVPSQTVLIQQPAMYYAATPMYVVESKPQMMLVQGGTQQTVGQVSHVELNQGGLMQVGGLQGTQGVVLVDRKVGAGGGTGQGMQSLPRGTLSRSSQLLVVQNGSSGGEQSAQLAQGFVQVGQGSSEQDFAVRSHSMQMKAQGFSLGSRGSAGSNEDFAQTATPKLQGSQRVVVQHKKMSATERNL